MSCTRYCVRVIGGPTHPWTQTGQIYGVDTNVSNALCNVGAMNWVQRMTSWSKLDDYNNANRTWFVNAVSRNTEIYVKEFDRFHFYWVLGGGHSVRRRITLHYITRESQVVLVVALVERWTRDRKVAGSTPGQGAIKSTRSTQPSIPRGR